jgi:hypothetical protein
MGALKIVDEMRVASPCQANWEKMPGDDRVRSCPECSRSVYNIAAMTSEEVAALIAAGEGWPCVRVSRRADETVLTVDCLDVAVEARPAMSPCCSPGPASTRSRCLLPARE